ncbi:MAG: T9SS type A sorting domain-containing protein [Bacteroidales bacterium]|jgi:hypothetical protein|nr:T9SS type A sorting domain-containing protein [Bacteroidales bacterium]
MKKIFVLTLILSIFCTAQAGYMIRGVSIPNNLFDDLKNYTLTFNDDEPIAAASTHSIYALGIGKNTIVIVQANSSSVHIFPIVSSVPDAPNDVEVRDFHYDRSNESYVLCGSRRSALGTHAFVAVIDGVFNTMLFHEYPNADMFYSVCIPNPDASTPILPYNYYLCGTTGGYGVIASVDRLTLLPTNFHVTTTKWEYHKIIQKRGTTENLRFIASGRHPDRTHIGFTTLNAPFTITGNYMWEQITDPFSHCVVSDEPLTSNAIVLASSYHNTVTLNPVTYPISFGTPVRAYHFNYPNTAMYFVQDIGIIRLTAANSRISVAGFKVNLDASVLHAVAWHGYVPVLPNFPMSNNDYYYVPDNDFYEHYKIRYNQSGKEYTGGSFRSADEMGALFGTPLTTSYECDDRYYSDDPEMGHIPWDPFYLSSANTPFIPSSSFSFSGDMEAIDCSFEGKEPTPKLASAEDESEIITFHDRITVKDIPVNTNYQIYNVVGQLIQTGSATPDISTASLNKGIYILRLETGKTFKFVK